MNKLEVIKESAKILGVNEDNLLHTDEDTLMDRVVAKLLREGYRLDVLDGGGLAFYKSY